MLFRSSFSYPSNDFIYETYYARFDTTLTWNKNGDFLFLGMVEGQPDITGLYKFSSDSHYANFSLFILGRMKLFLDFYILNANVFVHRHDVYLLDVGHRATSSRGNENKLSPAYQFHIDDEFKLCFDTGCKLISAYSRNQLVLWPDDLKSTHRTIKIFSY